MTRVAFFIVVVGLGGFMYATKPTMDNYRTNLERRHAAIEQQSKAAWSEMVGAHPLDEMIGVMSPKHAVEQTHYKDYLLVAVFTVTYHHPRRGPQRIRMIGLMTSLMVLPERRASTTSPEDAPVNRLLVSKS